MSDKIENPVLALAQRKVGKVPLWVFAAVLVLIAVLVIILIPSGERDTDMQVSTISALEKIVNVSELSTFQSVYNGVAEVHNEKKPENIDFYVSYEATVKAGIDFSKITIEFDGENTIVVTLPQAYITDTTVEVESFDYIFVNKKANTQGVTEYALNASRADLDSESKSNDAILSLAQDNAKNVITALLEPVIKQMSQDYVLVVK